MIRRLWTLADGWGQQMGQPSEPPSADSAARRGRSRRQRATVRGRGGGATAPLAARNPVAPSDLWPLNAKQVQMWLGHHAPAFILSTYVHLLPKSRRTST